MHHLELACDDVSIQHEGACVTAWLRRRAFLRLLKSIFYLGVHAAATLPPSASHLAATLA
jgi:hypothetical protein